MTDLRMNLLRHAYSMGNAAHQLSGHADVPLAPEGERMVRDYRAQGVYERHCLAQRYYSSPLRRCLQTFELALGDRASLHATVDDLREVDFGEMEGVSLDPDGAHAFFARWVAGEPEPGAPHLESFSHLQARGLAATRRIALDCVRDGVESVTVVSHSGISRAVIGGLADLPAERWLFIPMPNALGYTLSLRVDPALSPDDPASTRLVRAVPYGPDAADRPTIEP